MYSIILCGGSGTRLWPLSRKSFPKPFLELYSDKSLIQETFERMAGAISKENIFIVTDKDNFFNVYHQVKKIYSNFKKEQIIVEPISRDTAPAIMLAIKYLNDVIGIDRNAPIIEVHSDHYIGKKDVYLKLVKKAMKSLGDNIGLIGITPTKPSTELGYIKKGKKKHNHYEVASFKEKPTLETAKKFLGTGAYVWNAGMYLFSVTTFEEELKICANKLYTRYAKPYAKFVADFEKIPKIAIDYALAEKSKKIIVFEGNFAWNDIGSFDVLAEIAAKNKTVNTRHLTFNSKCVYTNSSNDRLIVTVGIDDINVVENRDVILIQKKGEGSELKNVVKYLKKKDYKEIEHNLVGYRPWGRYDVLIDEKDHKVKKIVVYPGAFLSLQSHKYRAEHWVVVKGTAKVVNGENLLTLHENESTYISAGSKHRLSNPGKENLEIIEVQTGSYLEEDDIVRYDDIYARETPKSDQKKKK